MRFILMLIGVLILSTAVIAAETKENPSSKAVQEMSPEEHLKLLQEVNKHNEVFDNYHTGGMPYEHPSTIKGK